MSVPRIGTLHQAGADRVRGLDVNLVVSMGG